MTQNEQVIRKRKSIEEKVAEAKQKEAIERKRLEQAVEKRKQLEQAQKKHVSEQIRKDDTRRKILLGSLMLKKMQDDGAEKQKILSDLNEYLTEDRDRKLFNL